MLKMTTWGEFFKRIEEYNIVNTGRHKNVIELLKEECKKYNIECYPIEMYSLNSYKIDFNLNGIQVRENLYYLEPNEIKNIVKGIYNKLYLYPNNAIDIANIIIYKQNILGNDINNLTLNKLLFSCQKHCIYAFNVPMFNDAIELNKFGFKVPSVDKTYNIHSTLNIYTMYIEGKIKQIDKRKEVIIDSVLQHLGKKTASQLLELNRYEKPYEANKQLLNDDCGIEITSDDMIKWYGK